MVLEQGNVNLVGTDVLNSALPWYQFGPDIARMLAQTSFGNLSNIQQAQIAAGASTQNAATQAGATLGAAGISAQAGIERQLIATNGAIAQNNAQMKTDGVLAAAGDINAHRRLIQEQQYGAQLENNANRMEIAKLAGSGSLFDNIAARFAASGQGALPQMGGAFGLAGGIQNVSAPTGNAPLSIEDVLKFIPQAQLQSGGGGGFDFSSLAGLLSGASGGGAVGGGVPNIGDLFSGLNQSVFDSLRDVQGPLIVDDPNFTAPTLAPNGQIAGSPEAIAATDAALQQLLAAPGSGATQSLHAGGRLKPGESGITGDDRFGRLTPFSELIKNVGGEVQITPLRGNASNFRGGFHAGTAPHSHDEKGVAIADTAPPVDPVKDPITPAPPPGAVLPPDWVDIGTPPPPPGSVLPREFPDRAAFDTPTSPITQFQSPFGRQRLAASGPGINLGALGAEGSELAHITDGQLLQRGFSRKADGSIWHRTSAGPRAPITDQQRQQLLRQHLGTGGGVGVLPGEDPTVEPDATDPDSAAPGLDPDTAQVLSDINRLPALERLRGNIGRGEIFDFGKDFFSRPELGIDPLPSPFSFGKNFLTAPQGERNDIAEIYKSLFGLNATDLEAMFRASQPGFRRFGGSAFAF